MPVPIFSLLPDKESPHEHRGQGRDQAVWQLHRPRPSQPRSTGRLAGCAAWARPGRERRRCLRIIAGLEIPDEGAVYYQDEDVTQQSARDRNVGFVFQHYALFRHMTVFENIAFGLRVRRWAEPEDRGSGRRIAGTDSPRPAWNGAVPPQLSGGQRQRVALARAWPCSPSAVARRAIRALDAKVRQELRQWLRRLHDEIHMTSVFVTHDQEEAFEVADHVVVMRERPRRANRHASGSLRSSRQSFHHGFLGQRQRISRAS